MRTIMPSFKPKSSKTIQVCTRSTTTLDGKHREIIERIDNDENDVLPKLRETRKSLVSRRNKAKDVDERMTIEEEIAALNSQIRDIKNAKTNYYLDNSKYVFDYFEAKKDIASCKNKTRVLNKFFNLEAADKTEKEINSVKEYLASVDETFLDMGNYIMQTDVCRECNKGELIPIEHEGIHVCNVCHANISFLVEHDKPSYKEPPKEVCFYAYKRINHFREILAQFQAKETTQIPDEILENIKQQIKKERINCTDITNKRAKDILKKLGYNKYYEHIPFIKDKLGIKPPVMSPELEERLCSLFMDIQAPYSRYCPDDRVNFLNYYYTVYKLCELLEQHHFLPFFPMLKDREKRIEQDDIWRKICDELDWEFIPTV